MAKSRSGEDVGLYFDPNTKLLMGFAVTDTETMLGDVPAHYILADYKAVDGISLPHRITIRKGGQDYSDVQFASIAINDPAAQQMGSQGFWCSGSAVTGAQSKTPRGSSRAIPGRSPSTAVASSLRSTRGPGHCRNWCHNFVEKVMSRVARDSGGPHTNPADELAAARRNSPGPTRHEG
jgi:hypothetical protein